MKQCRCGSYAINDDPEEKWCDKCLLIIQRDTLLAFTLSLLEGSDDYLFSKVAARDALQDIVSIWGGKI